LSNPHRRRVLITGIGVVSPNGVGAETFAAACLRGTSGIAAPQGIDTTGLRTTALAQVRNFDPHAAMDPTEVRRVPRMIPMAIAASREAMDAAGFRFDPDDLERQRTIGIALGTGGGGMAFVEEQAQPTFDPLASGMSRPAVNRRLDSVL